MVLPHSSTQKHLFTLGGQFAAARGGQYDRLLQYTFDMSKKEKRRIIEMHQTWTDCMMEEVETHHELFAKAIDQLVKEIKKKERAAKVRDVNISFINDPHDLN